MTYASARCTFKLMQNLIPLGSLYDLPEDLTCGVLNNIGEAYIAYNEGDYENSVGEVAEALYGVVKVIGDIAGIAPPTDEPPSVRTVDLTLDDIDAIVAFAEHLKQAADADR